MLKWHLNEIKQCRQLSKRERLTGEREVKASDQSDAADQKEMRLKKTD